MANKELAGIDATTAQKISEHMYNLYIHYRSQAAAYLGSIPVTISQSQFSLWSQPTAATVAEEFIYSPSLNADFAII